MYNLATFLLARTAAMGEYTSMLTSTVWYQLGETPYLMMTLALSLWLLLSPKHSTLFPDTLSDLAEALPHEA